VLQHGSNQTLCWLLLLLCLLSTCWRCCCSSLALLIALELLLPLLLLLPALLLPVLAPSQALLRALRLLLLLQLLLLPVMRQLRLDDSIARGCEGLPGAPLTCTGCCCCCAPNRHRAPADPVLSVPVRRRETQGTKQAKHPACGAQCGTLPIGSTVFDLCGAQGPPPDHWQEALTEAGPASHPGVP
jgi:hypothetical protein